MAQEKRIGFNDLNGSLKVLVVFGWIMAGLFTVGFLIGFVEGLFSVL